MMLKYYFHNWFYYKIKITVFLIEILTYKYVLAFVYNKCSHKTKLKVESLIYSSKY